MSAFLDPGVHDLPEADYHSDRFCPAPSLSNSIAKTLIRKSPRHAWFAHPKLNPRWEPENKTQFDLGRAAHSLVLGDKERFVVVEAAGWQTKAAKAERDAAYLAGKTPLLRDQYERTVEMAAACHAQLNAHEDAANAYTNGEPEQTLIWKEGEIWCRARLDWLPAGEPVFYDYKSTGTSANPDEFYRTLFQLGYDFQAAFYRRGITKVLGIQHPEFHFVVQENYPPYALSVIGLPPAYVDQADKRVAAALKAWSWCLEHDSWPGYPSKVCYVEAPPWIEAMWLEREARESTAEEAGGKGAMFRQMIEWQSPFDQEDDAT